MSILDNAKASYDNIFVGGFSQGGCLSLHMIRSELMVRLPEQLKGIFSLGSFLVSKSVVLQQERIISDEGNALLDIPILMMHGMRSPVEDPFNSYLFNMMWCTERRPNLLRL